MWLQLFAESGHKGHGGEHAGHDAKAAIKEAEEAVAEAAEAQEEAEEAVAEAREAVAEAAADPKVSDPQFALILERLDKMERRFDEVWQTDDTPSEVQAESSSPATVAEDSSPAQEIPVPASVNPQTPEQQEGPLTRLLKAIW